MTQLFTDANPVTTYICTNATVDIDRNAQELPLRPSRKKFYCRDDTEGRNVCFSLFDVVYTHFLKYNISVYSNLYTRVLIK